MRPFDVPMAISADTARHVGRPKLRLPASEKAWLVILRSFVHLTTSHGACGVSVPAELSWEESCEICEDKEICRECGVRKAGDSAFEDGDRDADGRASNRLSKGCRAPEIFRPTVIRGFGEATRPGEDSREPCIDGVSSGIDPESAGLMPGLLAVGVPGPSSGTKSSGVRVSSLVICG